jgi:hypothetical protein
MGAINAPARADDRTRRNDHDGHGSTHGPAHGPLHGPAHGSGSKDISGGAMGKFAVKSTPDKMRSGGDENRKPKDEWRRGTCSG